MNKRFLLLPAFCLLLSCSSPTTPGGNTASAGNTPLWIALGEERTVGALRIQFVDLNDSRCPPDVVCVWEGDGVVTLSVDGETVVLHTHGGPGMPKSAIARGHRFTLEELVGKRARITVVREGT